MKRLIAGLVVGLMLAAMAITPLFAQDRAVGRIEVRDKTGELVYVCSWYLDREIPCLNPDIFGNQAATVTYSVE